MKFTVLVDNNTLIDHYFIGEPAVSYFIETEGKRILYDVGYSDAFIKNAHKLKIDLLDLDYVILSHGHLDHVWGLDALLRMYSEASLEGVSFKKPTLIIHEKTFNYRPRTWLGGSGSLIEESRMSKYFDTVHIDKPYWLTDKLVCLPNIPKMNGFEVKNPFSKIRIDDEDVDDFMEDEIAIAFKSANGIVVSNPCSHRGICNTIEYAMATCKDNRIIDVVCGFHLQNPSNEVLDGTVNYFSKLKPTILHPCHCTDLRSKIALSQVVSLQEVGSGLQLEYKA